jgi:hypothetical protein
VSSLNRSWIPVYSSRVLAQEDWEVVPLCYRERQTEARPNVSDSNCRLIQGFSFWALALGDWRIDHDPSFLHCA